MANEAGAILQERCQFWERKVFRKPDSAPLFRDVEGVELLLIRFAAYHEQRRRMMNAKQPLGELHPVLDWPILRLASAARMESDHRSFQRVAKRNGEISISRRRIKDRCWVGQFQTKLPQRLRQLSRGVLLLIDLRRTGQKFFGAATPDIAFEDSIRIEEVAQDEIEAGEVVA